MGNRASAFTWVFGNATTQLPAGKRAFNNSKNSSAAGVAYDTGGWGEQFTFHIETNDSAWGYQIRSARTSSGPWRVLSSNSGTSTLGIDIAQHPGPLGFVSVYCTELASTANYLIARMVGIEA